MEREAIARLEGREEEISSYLYHHSRPLRYVQYNVIQQERTQDDVFGGAYDWIERQLSFYPVFIAVGKTEVDLHMTGYQNQWAFKLGDNKYRQKGEIENQALFSFKDIPQNGTFMDFVNWHIVLNSQNTNYAITNRETSMIFRPSWTKADWLRYGRRNPGSVQLVAPELDLRKANSIWVRNSATKKGLEKMGFRNVESRRLKTQRL